MSTKRKFRTHKDWYYNPDQKLFKHMSSPVIPQCTATGVCYHYLNDDDDHAALMNLKADPYEALPTLDEIIHKWWKTTNGGGPYGLSRRIREAFPHIDMPPETDVTQEFALLRERVAVVEAERDRLQAAVDRVRALHDAWHCKECFIPHPCPTLLALDGDV